MNKQQLKWELARERFHIPDSFPPREKRQEKPIRDILAGILKKDEDLIESLPAVIAERWPLITGEQLAQHTRPAHLQNGILYVYADHPGWLTELKFRSKAHLLKKISAVYRIQDIRFQLDPGLHLIVKSGLDQSKDR